jgi:hypothetical protein
MGANIIARRESIGRNEVFGILDGDFVGSWRAPVDRPVEWRGSDGTVFGWRWERKEIENYLIDPTVVNLALNQSNSVVSIQGYQSWLCAARDRLPGYQAARAALAASRIRFRDLPSSFGKERGSERHPFPDSLDETSCRDGMRQVVAAHQQTQIVEVATFARKSCSVSSSRRTISAPGFPSGVSFNGRSIARESAACAANLPALNLFLKLASLIAVGRDGNRDAISLPGRKQERESKRWDGNPSRLVWQDRNRDANLSVDCFAVRSACHDPAGG